MNVCNERIGGSLLLVLLVLNRKDLPPFAFIISFTLLNTAFNCSLVISYVVTLHWFNFVLNVSKVKLVGLSMWMYFNILNIFSTVYVIENLCNITFKST